MVFIHFCTCMLVGLTMLSNTKTLEKDKMTNQSMIYYKGHEWLDNIKMSYDDEFLLDTIIPLG